MTLISQRVDAVEKLVFDWDGASKRDQKFYSAVAMAHNASNRDIFPARLVRAPQAEFFNSIEGLRNTATGCYSALSDVAGSM